MFKVHLIYDFMPMYYRYKALLEKEVDTDNPMAEFSYALTKLTSNVPNGLWYNDMNREDKAELTKQDISCTYYIFKVIENDIRYLLNKNYDVTVSVCFDSKTERKNIDSNYKGAREKKRSVELTDRDYEEIDFIKRTMSYVGYNVYKTEGLEADDLIYHIVNRYKDAFDSNTIKSNDKDIAINIQPGVSMKRYIPGKGDELVTVDNFVEYFSKKFKKGNIPCNMRYNAILLYLALVGDKVDNISGVKGFGNKAFNDFVKEFDDTIKWEKCCNLDYVDKITEAVYKYCFMNKNGEQDIEKANQFKASMILARPYTNLSKEQNSTIHQPTQKRDVEKLRNIFSKLSFKSLIVGLDANLQAR